MNLPPDFVQTIQNTFKRNGKAWLSAFPDLIAEASRRWNLTDIQPVANLSYNFVAFANRKINREGAKKTLLNASQTSPLSARNGYRGEKDEVVLKLGVPNNELQSEITALTYYNGQGACQLLDSNSEKGMFLLERLQPGRMLSTLEDDEKATRIAAEVMKHLWRPLPENRGDFIQLTDWFDGFKRLRKQFDGRTCPLPEQLVELAESLSRELLTENKDEVLLHGDFHHYNILESERGWLVIDPKGVVGPKGYEMGPLLTNPYERFLGGGIPRVQTAKRISILSEMLSMERERIRNWGICHSVLSAWWSLEDKEDWRYAIHCAEIIQQA